MTSATLYSTVYRMRSLTRTIAKIFVWLYGIQLVLLYALATGADAPISALTGPGLRLAVALATFLLVPRVFDAVLARIAAHKRPT